jgi:hypothetical protein
VPHTEVAEPVKLVAWTTVICRMPEAGRFVPIPGIVTRAVGSDASHDTVATSFRHTAAGAMLKASVGVVQRERTARCRLAASATSLATMR